MERTLQKVDKQNLMRTCFLSIQEYNTTNSHLMITYKRILKDQKKKRFFNYIRYFAEKKKDLRKRHNEFSAKMKRKVLSHFFDEWAHQFENEWNVKELTNKRESKIKLQWLATLKRQVSIRSLFDQFKVQSELRQKHRVMEEIYVYSQMRKDKKNKLEKAEMMYQKSLQVRTLLGFRFNQMISKSLEVITEKRKNNDKMRAFYGLKWHMEISIMQREYRGLVEQREVRDHFYAWIELAQKKQRKRELLESILSKKHYYDQLEAFGIWKKDSFFKTMVSLVNQIVIVPNNEALMENVFHSWRRAHQFGKVKHEFEKLADVSYQVTIVKRMFNQWKNAAAPDMKKYVAFKKAMKKISLVMVSRPFYQMIDISEKEKVKQDKCFYHLQKRKSKLLASIVHQWKNAITEERYENHRIKYINTHFSSSAHKLMKQNEDPDSEVTFEVFASHREYPNYQISSKNESQIAIIRGFQEYTQSTDSCLILKYFIALKMNTKVSKVRREQNEYAKLYCKENLKKKYLKLMIESYNNTIDDRVNTRKADDFYTQNLLARFWDTFQIGIRNSKKISMLQRHQARRVQGKILQVFRENVETHKKQILLEARYNQFVENKSGYLLRHSYFTWKNKYMIESYHKAALEQFQVYRNNRYKRTVLKAIRLEIERKRSLKDLEAKAINYYAKKTEFKLLKQ